MRVLTTALVVVLATTAFPPVPAAQAEDELPRRRPRLTPPSGADEKPQSKKGKKKKAGADDRERKNAKPIDPTPGVEPEEPVRATREPPPPPEPEEPRPPGKPGRQEEVDEKPEATDAPIRSERTMEEELGRGEEAPSTPPRLATLDENRFGYTGSLVGGMFLAHDAFGWPNPIPAGGASIQYRVGRFFPPELDILHRGLFAELSWLMAQESYGTTQVTVATGFHAFALSALAGIPVDPFVFYAKLGGALFFVPVDYEIRGNTTRITGSRLGLVYGLGSRWTIPVGRVDLVPSLELAGYRQGGANDFSVSLGFGVTF